MCIVVPFRTFWRTHFVDCLQQLRRKNRLAGYSTSVDEYVFSRYEQGVEAPLPKVERPEGFDALIADIESLDQQGRTDCALSFLDLSWEASEELIGLIARAKERSITRRDTIPSSMGNDEPAWGMSIVAAPVTISAAAAFDRAEAFGRLKKYARRLPRWAALGWRQGSLKSVDSAIWLEYTFEQDAATDELVQSVLVPKG
jgi:hypothetical protein